MSASKFLTNRPKVEVEPEEPELDETPTRVTFYVPVTTQGTADFRIDVPAYLLDRDESELRQWIRENINDAQERNHDTDSYDYDYDEITLT